LGTLRTILVVSVVFSHSPAGFVFVGGRNAVQLSFLISGFLISFVLVEKKSYGSSLDFYISRILRLYPIYFVVAVLTLAAHFLTGNSDFFALYRSIPPAADILLVVSNIFLFGQDWVMFSGVQHSALALTWDYAKSDYPLWAGLLLPQAWSLGPELSFYLIAPFLLLRRNMIVCVLLLSLALRAALIWVGVGTKDPFIQRFFPTELTFFMLGALSHQLLLPLYRGWFGRNLDVVARRGTLFLIALSLIYFALPLKEIQRAPLLLLSFVLLLPLAFVFQGRRILDQRIGELSYPIYIGHVLVLNLLSLLYGVLAIREGTLTSLAGVVASILFAALLNAVITRNTESFRRRFKRSRPPPPGIVATAA